MGFGYQSLVFAGSLAGSLALSGTPSRADVAVEHDIGDYLMKAIQHCWNMPANTHSIARVQISLNKDGSLAGPPKILGPVTTPPDKVAESAVRAIARCAPFPRLTSYAAHYDMWRDVILTFNPGEDSPGELPAADALDKLFEKYSKKAK
ncbi:MAG: hypothetical protein EOQ39_07395 [Mesorhizobium sp.]|uniref:cell envelope integrity protein TolA n=3 Tax=Mesorhizobium TaxID=68287 RepID=UPI000FCA38B9|nr:MULTISPECIES: cell envelope integrity protein TolA [unclassified Mesorhizobium]AZV22289.1 hypothetical protein EJ079_26280 [Mesorhizobium sp. M7A.F.Ce.TU.012.03.2.1]RVD64867.1 hypothetical protein EN750_10685 [Mesorhizobium sp. M7A.F.Ca.ET.027.03.2.1]RWB05815.1 MAG: hypothetical protein EOQ37_16370 [Mesorhizobium sp.]RWB16347.1 MAG: hypothetical protein EOQ39_07395 [Mesorhizobium sp.]RWP90324.1 MAG: hypothetical protein EOR12_11440 [Mesorhizobium sp.]